MLLSLASGIEYGGGLVAAFVILGEPVSAQKRIAQFFFWLVSLFKPAFRERFDLLRFDLRLRRRF